MSSPSTLIRFYDVYDLTPDYTHTRYFSSEESREIYFFDRIGLQLTSNQYVRIEEGKVKIPKNKAEIDKYCYMSIRTSLGTDETLDRVHYCFILDTEYISDMCTVVYYGIDVMQTFAMNGLFSSTMPYTSYVERCHELTDDIGDNIVSENFAPSEYFVNDAFKYDDFEYMRLVVGVSTADDTIDLEIGGDTFSLLATPITYHSDVYTCIRYFKFDLNGIENDAIFNAFLEHFSGEKRKEIVDMYICPRACIPNYSSNVIEISNSESAKIELSPVIYATGRPESENDGTISGYEPNNNKLFTYPFNMLQVSNGEGDVKNYPFEFFDTGSVPKFEAECSFIGEPSISVFPKKYQRKATKIYKSGGGFDLQSYNYDNIITLTNYPHCGYNADSYAMYQSQNGQSNVLRFLGATITGALMGSLMFGLGSIAGASVGATIGAGIGAGKSSTEIIANSIKAYNTADVTLGNQSGTNVAIEHGHKNFIFSRVCCNPVYAQQIDDYFTKFGYAQRKFINVGDYLQNNTRPSYAYIKTNDFTVLNGGFEQKYKTEISNIMNSGITFWFDTDVAIGDYTADNTPT